MGTVDAATHKSCFFLPDREDFYIISHTRTFIAEAVVKHAALSTFCSGGVGWGGRRRKHRWWVNIAYGRHSHCSETGGRTGQLAQLRESIFVSLLPPTWYFEDGAKNYSVLPRNHFIKQVSQTVGQWWLIAVAMEAQELMLPPGDAHFLSHRLCWVQISCLTKKGRLESYSYYWFYHAAHCIFSTASHCVTTTTRWAHFCIHSFALFCLSQVVGMFGGSQTVLKTLWRFLLFYLLL